MAVWRGGKLRREHELDDFDETRIVEGCIPLGVFRELGGRRVALEHRLKHSLDDLEVSVGEGDHLETHAEGGEPC